MKIAHISDIHHTNDRRNSHYKSIIKHLENENVDAIVLTGDLCDKAGVDFGSPKAAINALIEEFLDPASISLNIPRDNFVICPGNHDIDHQAIGSVTWDSISQSGKKDYQFALQVIPEIASRWSDFNAVMREWYQNSPNVKLGELVHSVSINTESMSLDFLVVNNVWFTSDCTLVSGDIIFPTDEMDSFTKSLSPNSKKILVSHARYQDASIRQAAEVEDLIFRNFQFTFSGHYHEPKPQIIIQHNGRIYSSQSRKFGEKYADSKSLSNANGFTILEIREIGEPTLHGFRESLTGEYVADVDYFPGGFTTIDASRINSNLADKLNDYKTITLAAELEDFNRDLLTHTLQTTAPKELLQIFVMPSISRRDTSKQTDYKESNYTLGNLSKLTGKTCIFGKKESGKTTLLNRIFVDAIVNHGRIAAKIDFKELGGGRQLKQVIARLLGIKERDAQKVLEDERFLLLVDDFDFEKVKQANELQAHLSECKNIICFQSCETIGVVSSELLELLDRYNFSHLFIEDFKSKQIQELCSKWFSEDKAITRSKLEILVNSFMAIGLSCNPLSVSIFLWIMEQQHGKAPINKFSLIDQFVEKTFSKHDNSELETSAFDYRNKTRVLALIAKKMLDEERDGYSLKRADVIGVIEGYLSRNSLKFDSHTIYDHFISVGILQQGYSECDSGISSRFRFGCLFTYYLMCEMGFNRDFLSAATSKERYLEFVDEIEMLSGKMRDLEPLLLQMCDWMWEFYGPACEKIEAMHGSYDAQFQSDRREFTDESLANVKKNGKPTEEDVEKILDSQLALSQSNGIIPSKTKNLTVIDRMTRLWMVVARTLKTTEEVTNPETKIIVLTKVIKASLAFSLHYRHQIQEYLSRQADSDRKPEHGFLVRFMPLVHQHVVKDALGTEKLNVLIREKIIRDNHAITSDGRIETSEYERFVTTFLYSDLDGEGYKAVLREFLDSASNKTLLDMAAFKLLGYYLFKSNTHASDDFFLNALGDLAKSASHSGRNERVSSKTKAIERFQKLRAEQYGRTRMSNRKKRRKR